MTDSDRRATRVLLTGGAGLLLTLVALAAAAFGMVRAEGRRAERALSERARAVAATFVETLAERVPDDAWIRLDASRTPVDPPSPRPFRVLPEVMDGAGAFYLDEGAGDAALADAAVRLARESSDAVVRLRGALVAVRRGVDPADALESARLPDALRNTRDGVALGLAAGREWARERALRAVGSTDEDAAAALLVGALDDGLTEVRTRRAALRAATALVAAAEAAVPVSDELDARAVLAEDGTAVLVRSVAGGGLDVTRVPADVVARAAPSKRVVAWVSRGDAAREGLVGVPLPGPGGWTAWAAGADVETERALLIAGFSLVALAAVVAFTAFVRGVLREARDVQRRAEFVATVGHELRTPVAVVRSAAEALAMGRARSDDDRRRLTEAIVRESERLSALLGNVLDFARMESGRRSFALEARDVGETVRRAIDAHRPALDRSGVRLDVDVAPDLADVAHDADAIGAVVVNLLDNAAKFAPGDVAVTVGPDAAGDGVEIRVADHGPGIPESERGRVFERFARGASEDVRRTRGTGIGLALVRFAIQAHEGRVSIVETEGGGATFVVSLPEKT